VSKAQLNYLLDGVIAVAFIASALSGIVFLFAGSGGYQGGHNPAFQTEMLGIDRSIWSDLHTWVSLVMIAGVVMHLILHWDWLVCMSRRSFARPRRAAPQSEHEICPTIS